LSPPVDNQELRVIHKLRGILELGDDQLVDLLLRKEPIVADLGDLPGNLRNELVCAPYTIEGFCIRIEDRDFGDLIAASGQESRENQEGKDSKDSLHDQAPCGRSH
jgi:hypothetical protein